MTLEEAVKLQTADTAELYGLSDRGTIQVGKKADINVIDFEALAITAPRMVYDLPAGAPRLIQLSRGYKATIVSGEVVREDGVFTGARPGALIRGRR